MIILRLLIINYQHILWDGWDLSILLHISLVDGFSVVAFVYGYQLALLFEYRSKRLALPACNEWSILTVQPLFESVFCTC